MHGFTPRSGTTTSSSAIGRARRRCSGSVAHDLAARFPAAGSGWAMSDPRRRPYIRRTRSATMAADIPGDGSECGPSRSLPGAPAAYHHPVRHHVRLPDRTSGCASASRAVCEDCHPAVHRPRADRLLDLGRGAACSRSKRRVIQGSLVSAMTAPVRATREREGGVPRRSVPASRRPRSRVPSPWLVHHPVGPGRIPAPFRPHVNHSAKATAAAVGPERVGGALDHLVQLQHDFERGSSSEGAHARACRPDVHAVRIHLEHLTSHPAHARGVQVAIQQVRSRRGAGRGSRSARLQHGRERPASPHDADRRRRGTPRWVGSTSATSARRHGRDGASGR